jgi:hypothetical protein
MKEELFQSKVKKGILSQKEKTSRICSEYLYFSSKT